MIGIKVWCSCTLGVAVVLSVVVSAHKERCSSRKECGSEEVCRRRHCVAERGARCRGDFDCPTFACYKHKNQTRVGRCGRCSDDSDCSGDDFPVCAGQSGRNRVGECSACISDDHCRSDEYCDAVPVAGRWSFIRRGGSGARSTRTDGRRSERRTGRSGGARRRTVGRHGIKMPSIHHRAPTYKCQPKRAENKPCSSSAQCQPGLSCEGFWKRGVCKPEITIGVE